MTTKSVLLKFGTYEDEITLDKRVSVQAVDMETGELIVSMTLGMMTRWLKKHGYRWRWGSSGIWERAA